MLSFADQGAELAMRWGLLGPEVLASQRRMRTLGLGAVVRRFNDLAVPGMGGIWFGKQLFIAILGIALAERARATGRQFRNIEIANAVEAIACWLALHQNGWQSDPRLLGRLKMQGKTDVSFRNVRQRGFYVTQPMRMRTVQPLLALGLVESTSERFNAFKCTAVANTFIEVACENYKPKNRSVLNNLLHWMQTDDQDCVKTDHSREALSPIQTLTKEACEILRERLVTGSKRRQALIEWTNALRDNPRQRIAWQRRPPSIEENHWRDIKVGALFFRARDSAIEVLDSTEACLGNSFDQRLSFAREVPGDIKRRLDELRERSRSFLDEAYDPSPEMLGTVFCRECSEQNLATVLRNLVARDGRVLQLRGNAIAPGPAFRGVPEQRSEDVGGDTEESGISTDLHWPEGISVRIQNLFFLNADLSGRLDEWLIDQDESGDAPNG